MDAAEGPLSASSLMMESLMAELPGQLTSKMDERDNAYVVQEQNQRQDRTHILGFIRHAMKPERFARFYERFEPMRADLTARLLPPGLPWMPQERSPP